jgi:hypothetical protein
MASLLLLLRAIIGGDGDEGLAGARARPEAAKQQLEEARFHDCVAEEETVLGM